MNLNATLLGEMVTFAIFVWFTMRFVMPPIQKTIGERQEQAAATVENHKKSQELTAKASADAAQIIAQANSEIKADKKQAKAQAETIVNDAAQDAKQVAAKIVADAKQQALLEQDQIRAALQKDYLHGTVMTAVEKVLEKTMTNENNDAIIDQAITEDS